MLLPTQYQQMIHLSRYARWLPEAGRRETWEETVDRYITYMSTTQVPGLVDDDTWEELREAILGNQILPSMRALMTAGPALERCNVGGYNCAYIAIDDPVAFSEVLYVLMCGTGVGFSVERQFIAEMPIVPAEFEDTEYTIRVRDSKGGWCEAFRSLIQQLYQGKVPKWDISDIREKGARLNTFGGRASGPQPLEELFLFTVEIFRKAAGARLNSEECHDICCRVGDIVVVGGVRRAALSSLSNLSDDRMRRAKMGEWYELTPWRRLANNSAAYTETPSMAAFFNEWLAIYESKSGERGIFNRVAAQTQAARYGRRDPNHEFGTNPCFEIILRSLQFCNLSEVVLRVGDSKEDIRRKVRLATILGTVQATMTNFRYLRDKWRKNAEDEYLLGVSFTGIFDNALMSGREDVEELKLFLGELRELAVVTNEEWADKLGIMPATAITCVKPSGNGSQLTNCSSGIHARRGRHYIRRVRADKKDPLAIFMNDKGFPCEDDVQKPEHGWIFSFPIQAPDTAVIREDITALDHLELWKLYQLHWCEHKPSITVDIAEHEWLGVGDWVFRNFDIVSGIAFMPKDDHVYKQMPEEVCDQETYEALLAAIPKDVNWDDLVDYEDDDNTLGSQELACSGGACEIVDLVSGV